MKKQLIIITGLLVFLSSCTWKFWDKDTSVTEVNTVQEDTSLQVTESNNVEPTAEVSASNVPTAATPKKTQETEAKVSEATEVKSNVSSPATESTNTPVVANTTKSFSLTAKKWSFSPSTITVNKGDTVKLTITSTDVTHGFFLPDFDVNSTLTAGKTTTVTFIASKTGSFTYSCSVYCGDGHSEMSGVLIIK